LIGLYAYRESQEIAAKDYGFYALVMAAMRKADDNNLFLLKRSWPGLWDELQARYNAPGGVLEEDKPKPDFDDIDISKEASVEDTY
tara:strand:- start:3222 stop:3479 length:258 start_codon:yes stop_codon:yes gene_type:complete